MIYYTYVLESISYKIYYIGCSENVRKRLEEHNKGKCRYTKGRMPWKIIYTERYSTLSEARKREYFLKTGYGRNYLKSIIKSDFARSSNGRTTDSGSVYPGSSPGLAVS